MKQDRMEPFKGLNPIPTIRASKLEKWKAQNINHNAKNESAEFFKYKILLIYKIWGWLVLSKRVIKNEGLELSTE